MYCTHCNMLIDSPSITFSVPTNAAHCRLVITTLSPTPTLGLQMPLLQALSQSPAVAQLTHLTLDGGLPTTSASRIHTHTSIWVHAHTSISVSLLPAGALLVHHSLPMHPLCAPHMYPFPLCPTYSRHVPLVRPCTSGEHRTTETWACFQGSVPLYPSRSL